jgi:solute carrier family 25 oxoglutarate transporter 11
MAEGGVKGFYRGIDSALMRQAVYATARLGLYFTFTDMIKERNDGAFPTQWKIMASLTAGAMGSTIGNPFDLALV